MLDKKKFYINGEWVSPKKSNDLKVIDPSTEEELSLIHSDAADEEDSVDLGGRRIIKKKIKKKLKKNNERIFYNRPYSINSNDSDLKVHTIQLQHRTLNN